MNQSEIALLSRAHDLFAGGTRQPPLDAGAAHYRKVLLGAAGANDGLARGYRFAAEHSRQRLGAAAATDAAMAGVIAGADRDRAQARELTRNVVDEARAEPAVISATPMAQREAMRRRAARLRAQHAHVVSARLRARRRLAELRALRYQLWRRRAAGLGLTARAATAVRAALSRLGCPYVWGATGPDQFDCSGLVQWSYAQAGIHLDRTTYQQINDGMPVPRSQVRPGDLVFPHAGHVQLAIGNDLVIEAPYAGASVRISPLGPHVAIRRPL
ncbi:C40 family peptidase [Mycobacterium sp. E735]|uniref:C40 family peptidase n=1 Tax=Mycobacterium sp. E735 TaxID=1834148 RepID=UPI0007FBF766|nr:C40 family peptidase [Mycobacterium sp. E735]OBG55262.1 hypothetical protein A5704_25705 [Mycobacterium sp. E735]